MGAVVQWVQHALAARTQLEFVLGVAADYNNVIATNFPQRADALAAEIAQSGPALVGLQEVALWRTQFPYNPASLPQTVSYDFLQILLDALTAHGMHYTTVVAQDNYDVSGPGLFSFGLMGVRLTDRTVILARTDLSTDELQPSNPQAGSYQHIGAVQTLTGFVPIKGSWLSVDAKTRGKTFRFITTHLLGPVLDGSPDPLLPQQAKEHGVTSASVHRDVNDPNMIVVTHRFGDAAAAVGFANSEALKAAMGKAGVISQPEFWFADDVEQTAH